MSDNLTQQLGRIQASLDSIAATEANEQSELATLSTDLTTIQQEIANLKAGAGSLSPDQQAALDHLEQAASSAASTTATVAAAVTAAKQAADAMATPTP